MKNKYKKPEFKMSVITGKKDIPVRFFQDLLNETIRIIYNLRESISQNEDREFGLTFRRININSPGDVLFTVDDKTNPKFADKVFHEFVNCCKIINTEETMPDAFDEDTLESFQRAIAPLNGNIRKVVFSCGRERVTATESIKEKVDRIVLKEQSNSYRCWTSLEGTLVVISGEQKKHLFKIRDILLPKPVKCFFNDDSLEKVLQAFEKRISVFGETKFNPNHIPVAIEVEKFKIMPEDSTLPKYRDLPSVDITGGLSIPDYMEKIRHAI